MGHPSTQWSTALACRSVLLHRARAGLLSMAVLAGLYLVVNWLFAGDHPTRTDIPLGSLVDLTDTVFIGHTQTDTDAVAAAIVAADFFGGGAAVAGPLNKETDHVLGTFGMRVPPPIETVDAAIDICLVDFNSHTQAPFGIEFHNIKCVIDHHTVRPDFVATDHPIYWNVKPWGSTCTILANEYRIAGRIPSPQIADLMLSAIISDTLNLKSPTTTSADLLMVQYLAPLATRGHTAKARMEWAKDIFRAKSDLSDVPLKDVLEKDLKTYNVGTSKVGYGVVESVDVEPYLRRKRDVYATMTQIKKNRKFDYLFISLVNILEFEAHTLVVDKRARDLVLAAYSGAYVVDEWNGNWCLYIGHRVSRKQQFMPPITSRLSKVKENFQHGLHPILD